MCFTGKKAKVAGCIIWFMRVWLEGRRKKLLHISNTFFFTIIIINPLQEAKWGQASQCTQSDFHNIFHAVSCLARFSFKMWGGKSGDSKIGERKNTKMCKNFVRIYSKNKQITTEKKLSRNWAETEQKLSRNWAETEQKLSRNWAETEQKLSKNWANTEKKLRKNCSI